MTGRLLIYSHKKRLDNAFSRVSLLPVAELEVTADFAKFPVCLVAGYIEKAMSEIVLEHARRGGAPSLQRFVETQTRRFTNANTKRILDLLGSFNENWRQHMNGVLVDQYKDSVDSVIALRHKIVHGESVGLTYGQIKRYYADIAYVVDYILELCIPVV
jgi:hypothetical protein